MKKLTPIKLEDGTVIYMEVKEDIEIVSDEITESVLRDLHKSLTRVPGNLPLQAL